MDPMEGLKPGRIVYYVFGHLGADEVTRRRITGDQIASRLADDRWPLGAQAHIGNPVSPGDICPAMVVAVFPGSGFGTSVNLKVMLDGTDVYWATSVRYDEAKTPGTWHWIFAGQNVRYQPDRVEKVEK
jgi:hypothetical protein